MEAGRRRHQGGRHATTRSPASAAAGSATPGTSSGRGSATSSTSATPAPTFMAMIKDGTLLPGMQQRMERAMSGERLPGHYRLGEAPVGLWEVPPGHVSRRGPRRAGKPGRAVGQARRSPFVGGARARPRSERAHVGHVTSTPSTRKGRANRPRSTPGEAQRGPDGRPGADRVGHQRLLAARRRQPVRSCHVPPRRGRDGGRTTRRRPGAPACPGSAWCRRPRCPRARPPCGRGWRAGRGIGPVVQHHPVPSDGLAQPVPHPFLALRAAAPIHRGPLRAGDEPGQWGEPAPDGNAGAPRPWPAGARIRPGRRRRRVHAGPDRRLRVQRA